MKVKDKLQPSDKAWGGGGGTDPPGLIERRTVYDALENIDSEFYPRKISVPGTENDETETTSRFETNKTETTSNLKPKGTKKQTLKPKIKANDQQKTKEHILIGDDQTEVKTRDKPIEMERTTDERKKHADSQNRIPS